MLHSVHVQLTLSNKPPFFYTVDISRIDPIKLAMVSQKESFPKFANACISDFQKLNLPYGSAHLTPAVWIQVALDSIKRTLRPCSSTDSEGVASTAAIECDIPNGCCNMPSCSINQLYQIVINNLSF